ncbi:MAG: UvrD-helicase domain-containing protein, partial [Ignavibacteria bacterium]|nr:UvrD-helicase domain-containing protein [Ignavibacteria bacterium]
MNEHLTKKIICASAGTGKTYRLSLEYLSLLLTYYGQAEFNPDQILVITFTRKATAEIKTRIIQHLQLLSEQAEGWQVLAINLKKLKNNDSSVNPANPLSDAELHLIRSAYFQLTNRRDLLQVLTIDAFIHRIYRNLICPVKGLDRFEVDLRAIEKRIPYILQEIMSPELFERANKLLLRGVKPSLEKYQTFLVSLIKSRFTQYLIEKRTVKSPETKLMYYVQHPDFLQTKAEENFQLFLNIYMMLLNNYYDHIKKMEEFSNSSIDYSYYFKSKFKALFN